jgi:hypothetical protein
MISSKGSGCFCIVLPLLASTLWWKTTIATFDCGVLAESDGWEVEGNFMPVVMDRNTLYMHRPWTDLAFGNNYMARACRLIRENCDQIILSRTTVIFLSTEDRRLQGGLVVPPNSLGVVRRFVGAPRQE